MNAPRVIEIPTAGKVAYLSVVVQGVAHYLIAGPGLQAPLWATLLLVAAIVYCASACSDSVRARMGVRALLVVQNGLALALPWLGAGHTAMAPLPAISLSGLLLSGYWVLLPTAVHTANVLAACATYIPGELGRQVAYIFVVAVVFVLAFTRALLREVQLRQRLAAASRTIALQASQAQELAALAERERIAREMHDSVGHALVGAHVHLQLAARHLTSEPQAAADAIAQARIALSGGLGDLRSTVRALSSPLRDGETLAAALERLAEPIRHTGLTVAVGSGGDLAALPAAVSLALFRVAQEGLTNAVKHGAASRVELTVDRDAAGVCLTVSDDGRGIGDRAEGFGLRGVRARLAPLGGRLSLADAGPGLRLCAHVPLPPVVMHDS